MIKILRIRMGIYPVSICHEENGLRGVDTSSIFDPTMVYDAQLGNNWLHSA